MADLTSLIARIEAATEGSRELDRDICIALGWHQVETNVGLDWRTPCGQSRMIPHLTTSLDAVLTLMPEGYVVDGLTIWPKEGCSVKVLATHLKKDGRHWHGSDDGHWSGEGPTAPLALLAAILKARQTAAQPANQAEARSSEQSGVRHD